MSRIPEEPPPTLMFHLAFWRRRPRLALAIGLCLILASGSKAAGAVELDAILSAARAGGNETLVQVPLYSAVTELSTKVATWQRTGVPPQAADLTFLGLEILQVASPTRGYTVVRERAGVRGGGGVYFFSDPAPHGSTLVLQVPHGFFEVHTASIGLRLLQLGGFVALFENTVHRFNGAAGGSTMAYPADVTVNGFSYFFGVTTGLALGRPDTVFVQLHGVSAGAQNPFDFVLADGTDGPVAGGLLSRAAAAFVREFGAKRTSVQASDVSKLDRASNLEATYLNDLSVGQRFLDVGVSPGERDRLAADPTELVRLHRALQGCAAPAVGVTAGAAHAGESVSGAARPTTRRLHVRHTRSDTRR